MTGLGGLDLLAGIVDLVVVFSTAGILGFALYRGFFRRWRNSIGGLLVVAGMALAVSAYLLNLWIGYFDPLHAHASLHAKTPGSAAWFGWLLSRLGFFAVAAGFLLATLSRQKVETDLADSRAELQDVQASRRESDQRLQYLYSSTSNSMYTYEFRPPMRIDIPLEAQIARSYDAVLVQCNEVFARELGGRQPDDVLGQPWSRLESSKDTAAHEALFLEFVENDYRISNYELTFATATGNPRTIVVNMIGNIRHGYLESVWCVESTGIEIRTVRRELRRRQRFQELVAHISSRLVKACDEMADREIRACMAEVAAHVGADRSLIFWIDSNDTGSTTLEYSFSRSGRPFDGFQAQQAFPACWRMLREQKIVRVDNIDELTDEFAVDRASFVRLGVQGIVIVPMLVDGQTVGGMSFSRIAEQEHWDDGDVTELRVISELLANFVLRLRSRRALNEAMDRLQRATSRLEAENVYLREEVELEHGFDGIIGESLPMRRSLQLVEQVANTITPVLVLGETGTGKELVARAIHDLSDRRDRPLVKVNCAALPANLIESELFGHEKGAFTGAESRKQGRFDLADGSTMFLDEIGEIPLELQAKLLRVLQEGEYERLGGTRTLKVDARIVAATNRDLGAAVAAGEFRSDLYYRINMFPIVLPPLRLRGDDIELLARHFIAVHSQRLGRKVTEISAEAMRQLRLYEWPGNVRELDGIIQRALISSKGTVLQLAEPLVPEVPIDGMPAITSSTIPGLRLVERDHILSVLDRVGWKISGDDGAAALLGLPPSTLRSKMKKLGISRP